MYLNIQIAYFEYFVLHLSYCIRIHKCTFRYYLMVALFSNQIQVAVFCRVITIQYSFTFHLEVVLFSNPIQVTVSIGKHSWIRSSKIQPEKDNQKYIVS